MSMAISRKPNKKKSPFTVVIDRDNRMCSIYLLPDPMLFDAIV